ncbi:MAG: Prolipoprotein diacylglyceryl transferase [Gemmatimonadetes bacterium]|jgi:phosphatidylglycerol:prolipoprotein diacylglycerol transferase|nr:Prolipoprotein diacylglyceryl transferase [Gemmatimonadota bacterium]
MSTPIIQQSADWHFGFIHLTGFGFAMMCAFGIAHYVSQVVLHERGDDPEIMNDVTFAALVGTIIGAKVYYAILVGDPRVLFGTAGFVFWGGFLGAVTLCAAVIRWRRQSFLRIADGAAVGIAAGYSIGRTGCWAVGDDFGRVWDSPLAVGFPHGIPPTTAQVMRQLYGANLPASIPDSAIVGVYPTQLLEVVLGFVMFVVLWRLRRHAHAAGWLFGVYCLLAGAERFVVEFFRAKTDMVGPLTSAQIVALAVAAAGVLLLTWRSGPSRTLASARS